jgi:hypothetical protein
MNILSPLRLPLVALVILACLAEVVEARQYQLWGGRASVNLPAGFKLRKAGPYAYSVLSMVRGRNPRVVSFIITRVFGSDGTRDWSSEEYAWNLTLSSDPRMRAVVRPRGSGNTFNVETISGSGRSSSRQKLRAINGPRRDELDLRNMYTTHLTAVPASAWSAPEGRSLLRAFNSFRVKR